MNDADPNQPSQLHRATTAVVVTTAMLTFISHWRAAAIVLCDLSSSAYYACGIAEEMVGKAAPWFVLGIMLCSMPVRWVFMESSTMFVRGGVYRVVKAAMGKTTAKIAVAALLFDFVLTGPISAVSAGQYLVHFLNETARHTGYGYIQLPEWGVMVVGTLIIMYFWRKNVIGVEESSGKALRIVQLTAVMVVLLLGWSIVTYLLHPVPLPPFTPVMHDKALGWLQGISWVRTIGVVGVVIALGHSVLAMSGEETLAQIYREIAAPKVANLRKAAYGIFIFSFLLTGVISLFAVILIPDEIRPQYRDNLLSGLAMHLAAPSFIKLGIQAFVVLVGVLLLAGAVNTALVGANGIMGRLAEDGILPGWVRVLHRRFGTTSRIVHIFALLQIGIVFASRGDVVLIGEAYAFGVLWSMTSIALATLVLRWRDHSPRDFRAPFNFTFGRVHMPIGLALTFLYLFLLSAANLLTKTTATKFGILFTGLFFLTFQLTERYNRRKTKLAGDHLEQVNLSFEPTATAETCGLTHEYRILVGVRDPNNLTHLRRTLERIDPKQTDLVVMAVRKTPAPGKEAEALPTDEQLLITNVVAAAEKYGVHVTPLIVPASDPVYAIAKAAYDLGAAEIVVGRSGKTRPEIQLEKLALAWGYVSAARPRHLLLRVIWPQQELRFELG
ncbi:MAG: amino acid permease [Deltaproteobacteria bacterium]|nr:amino acid permease [Deltaproteobacteria bacterium]